jgi:hypothetical protein
MKRDPEIGTEVRLKSTGKVIQWLSDNRLVLDIGGRWFEASPYELEKVEDEPEAWKPSQDFAAVNQGVYSMSDADRERWYRDNPRESFE